LRRKESSKHVLPKKLEKGLSIVYAYVYNRRQPSPETLFQIAEILGVDVKILIGKQMANLF
jgi:hypothetical protein